MIKRAIDPLPSTPTSAPAACRCCWLRPKHSTPPTCAGSPPAAPVVDPDGQDPRDEQALARVERAAHLHRLLNITEDQAGGAWINGRCTDRGCRPDQDYPDAPRRTPPERRSGLRPRHLHEPGCGHDGRDPRDHGARLLDALVEASRRPRPPSCCPRTTAPPRADPDDGLRGPARPVRVQRPPRPGNSSPPPPCGGSAATPRSSRRSSAALRDPRRRPHPTAGHPRDLEGPGRPGSALPVPQLHPTPLMCHAHHIVHWADGGPTSAGQPDLALRPPPPPDPLRPVDYQKTGPAGSHSTHHPAAAEEPPEPDDHHPTTVAPHVPRGPGLVCPLAPLAARPRLW